MPSLNFITRFSVPDLKEKQKIRNCGDTSNEVLEKVIMKVLQSQGRESFLNLFKNRTLIAPAKTCAAVLNTTGDLESQKGYVAELMLHIKNKVLEDASDKTIRNWEANVDVDIAVSLINHVLLESFEDKDVKLDVRFLISFQKERINELLDEISERYKKEMKQKIRSITDKPVVEDNFVR